ncbi:MAG TPA: TonB-dependent receptor [Candidatus Eisenbacteria bacterium]|nr:TonB-dependent receptor [Candidatus Eisenbacteria bacterium]
MPWSWIRTGVVVLLACGPWRAAGGDEIRLAASDLSELSLEQLNDLQVTSVSRRAERLSETAGSVFVLTAEDIRRLGAKTLPELLRLVPTLQVARADANQYAISARGFNSVFANKMLVLIDGRTVYSPLFSGVFWEAQDLLIQDLDRIEVLTGPGGTSWGTNAVNGIINIITRAAPETQGVLVAGGGGSDLQVGEARYGAGHRSFYYRAYGKYVNQEHSDLGAGGDVIDASERFLGGLRGRWVGETSTYFIDAGGIHNQIEQVPEDRIVSGYHVLGRWIRKPASAPGFRAQVYYERNERDQPGSIHDMIDTWDAEFQHEARIARHDLVWGAGYRFQPDRAEALGPAVAFIPEDRDLTNWHVFAEDLFHVADELDLTAGIRLEHNVYTELEYLPTVRATWRPVSRHLLWTSVSRAVRAPSRVDRELFSPAAPPHFILAGGPDFRSELANVAELGYRAQPHPALAYSMTGFYSVYDRLRSLEPSAVGPVFLNGIDAVTHGVEAWASYRVTDRVRFSAGGVAQNRDIDVEPGSMDINGRQTLGNDPHHWWMARGSFDLGDPHEIDLWVRQVGELEPSAVPGYTTVDGRIATRFLERFELSVTGYNLFGPAHAEWGANVANRAEFGPSFFAQLQWRL